MLLIFNRWVFSLDLLIWVFSEYDFIRYPQGFYLLWMDIFEICVSGYMWNMCVWVHMSTWIRGITIFYLPHPSGPGVSSTLSRHSSCLRPRSERPKFKVEITDRSIETRLINEKSRSQNGRHLSRLSSLMECHNHKSNLLIIYIS